MNSFQDLFDRQKRHFAMGATRSYAWRIEQLDRMARLVGENEAALQQAVAQDFKTAARSRSSRRWHASARSSFRKANSRIG
jgi:aldehyde dehydrogenase (NAD+)